MNTDKRMIKETVIEVEQHSENWPFSDAKLVYAMGWLGQQMNKLPKEYWLKAVINVETYEEYNSMRAKLTISYSRPETDDEYSARLTKEKEDRARRREQAIANAKATLARYGEDV